MTTQSLATPVEAPHDVMPVHGIDHLQVAGAAARRLETKPGRDFFSSVFRFTIEFCVVYESDPATPTPTPSCDDDTPARFGAVGARG
jgi:hypothetical protein